MCENRILCDYPVSEKETKNALKLAMVAIRKALKEKTGEEWEWVNTVYASIIESEVPKKLCASCAVRFFVVDLVLEKAGTFDPIILECGLAVSAKIAIIQHTHAAVADSGEKMKKPSNVDCVTRLIWYAMRLQRIEYKQPKNVTDEEREIMRQMRGKGESFRDLAYIFDRSVSTVHQVCQDVEVVESESYY
jgi:hypothetical protein